MEQIGLQINAEKYFKKFKEPKKSAVHRVVDWYLELRGWSNLPKQAYRDMGVSYPRLCGEAKRLLENCGGSDDDAYWALWRLYEDSKAIGFKWTIITATKYKRFYGNDKRDNKTEV